MGKRWLSYFKGVLGDLLIPPRCPSCGLLLPIGGKGDPPFCGDCLSAWEREKLLPCPVCKLGLPDCVCVPARLREVGVRDTVFLVAYRASERTVPDRLIYYAKENRDPRVFSYLGRELWIRASRLLRAVGYSDASVAVVFLPRSIRSIRKHGFDQARELALVLSHEAESPTFACLRRRREAREQKTLTREERAKNLSGAFRLKDSVDVRGRVILLVDDVVTTGSGLAECAALLLSRGAASVIPVTVARTEEKTGRRLRDGFQHNREDLRRR